MQRTSSSALVPVFGIAGNAGAVLDGARSSDAFGTSRGGLGGHFMINQGGCTGYIGRNLEMVDDGEEILPVKIGLALVQNTEVLLQTN